MMNNKDPREFIEIIEASIRITSIEWSDNLSNGLSSEFKKTAKTIEDSVFEITVYESYKCIKIAKYPFPWWKTKHPACLVCPLVNINVTAGCLWLHAYLNVLHRRMFFSFLNHNSELLQYIHWSICLYHIVKMSF